MNFEYLLYVCLGIFPLTLFIFSLIKPTRFTKKILPPLIAMLVLLLLVLIGRELLANYLIGKWILMFIIVVFPPAATLLMALSGANALADRCSPQGHEGQVLK